MRAYIVVLFLFISFSVNAQLFSLSINIQNIKIINGDIRIGIFNNKKDFLKEGQEFRSYSLKVLNHSEVLVVKNLEKGIYAVSVYHDVNSDNKCNTTIVGVPTEAYGFSNNHKPRFTKPSFKDCLIVLNEDKAITINLINK